MSLSHYEIEITVRAIDNFNAPIEEHKDFMTAKSKNEICAWLKYAKLNRLKSKLDEQQPRGNVATCNGGTPPQTSQG